MSEKLPAVLLKYQQQLLNTTAICPVVFCEKSRRIGMTWAVGADAVLTSAASRDAGGMDTLYIGFNLDMTREFIDTCGQWAKQFGRAASAVEEFMFEDQDEHGETKEIKAFRITFDSGLEIMALTSRPRSLRGRQGYVIIDEAAFHDDLPELMKAALALLIWGGKVLVISTHDGADNAFNQYIIDAAAGRNNFKIVKVDFDQALGDGLYQRICLVTGKTWSPAAQETWRQEIIDFYGDGADEELFCIPRKSSGNFLPGILVESRMVDVPVLHYNCNDQFVFRPDHERERETLDWLTENVKPLLDALSPKLNSFIGGDFARSGDLSIFWPIQQLGSLVRHTPFTIELRNVPFKQQQQILWYVIDRLPRFCTGAFDARGNGQQMAEETMQRYGASRILQVMTAASWYQDAFPKYKAALEDAMFTMPRDADILNDHRVAVVQRGVPQIPDKRVKGADGGKRHGDSLIAAAMAYWASLQDFTEYGYDTLSDPSGDDDRMRDNSAREDHEDSRSSWNNHRKAF